MNIAVHSLHWTNLNPTITKNHKKVYTHFEIPVNYSHHNIDHGEWKRVFNMLAAHAIIYLKQPFVEEVIKQAKQCISEGICWDNGLASLHRDFTILTPNSPLFYQKDLPQYTNFVLNTVS